MNPSYISLETVQDVKGMKGDFPGVTSKAKQIEDLANCPDPNLILKIEK